MNRESLEFSIALELIIPSGYALALAIQYTNRTQPSAMTITPQAQHRSTIARRKLGLTHIDRDRTAGGFTLYAGQTAKGKVHLVDIDGNLAHCWQMPVRAGRDAVILANGNLGYNGSHRTSAGLYPMWDTWHGGHFYEVTHSGDVVWEFEDIYHHHDAQWLPSGNLLYTAAHPMPQDKAARVSGGDPSRDRPDGVIQSDIVKEVNRAGETVWEWKIWEHVDPADFPVQDIFDRVHWPMINGLTVTKDNLVLMSLRTTSGILAVDKQSKNIAWYVGPDVLAQQHTPVEMDNGSILVFDNGNYRKGSFAFSRVLEFTPESGEIVWSYTDPMPPAFYSPYMGGAERLWNGNTLVCESAFGRLFEITPDGDTVWEYVIPEFAEYPEPLNKTIVGSHNSVFRAHRYHMKQLAWLSR